MCPISHVTSPPSLETQILGVNLFFKFLRNSKFFDIRMAEITQESNGESEQPMEQEEKPYEKTEQFNKLFAAGVSPAVAEELDKKLYAAGLLEDGDLDERAVEALREFDLDGAREVIMEFSQSKLQHVSNKSAYLCGVMKVQRQKANAFNVKPQEPQKGPDEEKINSLLIRTGYSLEVTTGQRKYGGPPPDWGDEPQPRAGHEVFIGKIPRDVFEDVLVPLLEDAGRIWDLRIMMDPISKLNKGYGFVTFCTTEAAKAAVEQLDGKEIVPGKKLKVNSSVGNVRLYVGNIPKGKSKEEIQEEFGRIVDELTGVIVYLDHNDAKKKNRGFAFLDFANHKAASTARRKLALDRTKVWGCDIIAEWADPQTEPDEETMAKVKVLYVSKLSSDVSEEMLKIKFEQYGTVERVKKLPNKGYGFVHFENREDALQAMKDLDGMKFGQNEMYVTLAKPPQTSKRKEMRRMRSGPGFDFSMGFGGRHFGGYGIAAGGFEDFYHGPLDLPGFDDYHGGYYDYYSYGRGRGGMRGGMMASAHGMGPRGMMRARGGMRGGSMYGGRGGPRGMIRSGFGFCGMGTRAGKPNARD